jgi:hypothetical protein
MNGIEKTPTHFNKEAHTRKSKYVQIGWPHFHLLAVCVH